MAFFMPHGAAPVPAWRSGADDEAFSDQMANAYGPPLFYPFPVSHNSGKPEFSHIYPYPMYVYPAPFHNVYEQDGDGDKKFRHAPYCFVPGGSAGYPGFFPVPMVGPEENEEDVNDQKQTDSRFQHPRFVAMPAINGDPLAVPIQQGAHPQKIVKYPHFVTYPDDDRRRDDDDDGHGKSGSQYPLVFMPYAASDGRKKQGGGFQQPAYFVPPMFDGRALQPQRLNENKGSKMQSQRPQSVPGMHFPADNKEQYSFPYSFPSMDPSSCYQLYGPPYMKGVKPISPQLEIKPSVHRDENSQDQNLWMKPQKPMFCLPSSSRNDVSSSKENQKSEKQKPVPVLDTLGNLNALHLPSNNAGQEKIKDVSLDYEPSSQAAIRVIPVRPVKEENLSKQIPKVSSQDKQVKDTKEQFPALNDVKSEVGGKQTQSALDKQVHNPHHNEVKPEVNKQVNAKGKQGFPPLKLVVDDCKKSLKGSPSSFSGKDQGHAKPKIKAEEKMQGTKATKTRNDEVSAKSNQMSIEEVGQSLRDIGIKTARKDGESPQSCQVRLEGSKDIDVASKCDKSGESKEVEGALQKSDNDGKDVDLTGVTTFLDETAAATYIQSRVRGFLVRKSQPLTCLKNVAMVKSKLEDLKSQLPTDEDLDKVCSDPKECVKLSETLMALLLQLDKVQGVHPVVRDIRKSVSKELLKIQDYVDNAINRVSSSVNQAVPAGGNRQVLNVEKADKNVSPGLENQGHAGMLLDQASQVSCPSTDFKDIQKQGNAKQKGSMSPEDLGNGQEGGQQEKQSDSSMYLLKLDENGQGDGDKAERLQEIDKEKSLLKSGENIENLDCAKLEHSTISCSRGGIHDVVKDGMFVILPEDAVKNEVEVAGSIVKEKGGRLDDISSSVNFAQAERQDKAEQALLSELSDSTKVSQGVSFVDIESKLVEGMSQDQSRRTGQDLNEEQGMNKDQEFYLSPTRAVAQNQEGKVQHETSISMNFAQAGRQELTERGCISDLSDSAKASQGVSFMDTESKLVEGMRHVQPHDQSRQDQRSEQDLNAEQEMKQDQRSEQDLAEKQEIKQDPTQQFHLSSMLADVQSEEKDQIILMEGSQEMAMDKSAEVESTLKMGNAEEGQESTSDISCHGEVVQECCSEHVGTDLLSAIDKNKQEVEGMSHDQPRDQSRQDQRNEQDLNVDEEMKQDQRSEQDVTETQEIKQDLTQQFHLSSMLADVQSEEKDQIILMEGSQEMAMDKSAEVESTLKVGNAEEGQESTSDITCHGQVVQQCCSEFHVCTDLLSAIDKNKQEEFSRKTLAKECVRELSNAEKPQLKVRHLEVNNEGAHSHEFDDIEEVASVLDSSKHHHMTELETIKQGQLEQQHYGMSNVGIERHQYFSKQDASKLEKVAECEHKRNELELETTCEGHKNRINEILSCRDVSSGPSIDNQNAYPSSTLPVQVDVCHGGFEKVTKSSAALLGSMEIENSIQQQADHNDLDGGNQRDIDIPKVGSPLRTDFLATSACGNPSIGSDVQKTSDHAAWGSDVQKTSDHAAEVHETSDHAVDEILGCLDHARVVVPIPKDVEDATGQKVIINNDLYLLLAENRQLNSMVKEMVQYAQSQAASLVHLQQRIDRLEKRILRKNLRRSKLKFRA